MYNTAANLVRDNKEKLSELTSQRVKDLFPNRTTEYNKCSRDIGYILNSVAYCLEDNTLAPIEHIASMFFKWGKLQVSSLHVEFDSYDFLLRELKQIFISAEPGAYEFASTIFETLKKNLANGIVKDKDNLPITSEYETRMKHVLYGWDDERRIMEGMQQCQRNWNTSVDIPKEAVDYLLWIAQNAPSKQHEAYYDVHWSTDRETIDYLYQFSWGSTHRKNPPAMWRNSQMNANIYMIFVCKVPDTMYNCNNDGTLQDPFGESRWENAIVSVGMAMGLVMRAAHKMGLKTGPNKVKDLGPDYNYEWEKKLEIYDDVKAGTKRLFFGLGIGLPNEGRPRWESDDPEIAIGSSNGHNMTILDENDPNWKDTSSNGSPMRKSKIVDIREHANEVIVDPYGVEHVIPDKHEIKINTVRQRDIKIVEIPTNDNNI